MKGYLLDVNLLIALAWPNHPQHEKSSDWFTANQTAGWSTCLVTQLGFVRISSNPIIPYHVSTQEALRKLKEIIAVDGHSFWSEPPGGFDHSILAKTVPDTLTHGMVTDGYLAAVAAFHKGRLATLDQQLSRVFRSYVVLI